MKSHLFETLEGVKNLNDPDASENEKVTIEQAKSISDISKNIIDIYKTQISAVEMFANMDNVNSTGKMLIGMGVMSENEVKEVIQ